MSQNGDSSFRITAGWAVILVAIIMNIIVGLYNYGRLSAQVDSLNQTSQSNSHRLDRLEQRFYLFTPGGNK